MSIVCFSQDIITLRRGIKIEAHITEVAPTIVRYKLFSDPQGSKYFVYKEDVLAIQYQNGMVDIFNQSENSNSITESKSIQTPKESSPDLDLLSNNTYQQASLYAARKASENNPTYFSQVHIGLAIPSGDFASASEFETNPSVKTIVDGMIYNGIGNASTGFNIGYKYYRRLWEELYMVAGIDIFYNGLKSDINDAIKEAALNEHRKVNKHSKYFNFPLTVGLNYSLPLHQYVKLYGEAAIGANLSVMTKMDFVGMDDESNETYTFTPAVNLAYGLEAGLFIYNKVSLSVRYNHLGSHQYWNKRGRSEEKPNEKPLSIANISACVGLLF